MVFGFQLTLTTIIVPFDFVSVENVFNSRTIGIIKELEAVQKNALGFEYQTRKGNSKTVFQGAGRKQVEGVQDITIAKVAIMGDTGANVDGMKDNNSISMPVRIGSSVKFAAAEEVTLARFMILFIKYLLDFYC